MNMKRQLSKLLACTLLLTSIPTQTFAQPVVLGEQTTGMSIAQITTPGAIQTTTPGAIQLEKHIYVGDGYEVEFKLESYWEEQFEGKLIVKNTGEETIENWSLGFDFPHEITQIWEAEICEHKGDTYIVKNRHYNQDILSGESLEIGFVAEYTYEIGVPKGYNLLVMPNQVNEEDYKIDFKVTSD